jgi:hypothetical protein
LRRELQEPVLASAKADVGDSSSAIKRKAALNKQEIKKQRTIMANENKGKLQQESLGDSIKNAIAIQESIYELNTIGRMEEEINDVS